MQNLRQRTLSGLGWSGATQTLGLAFQFAVSIGLARLLNPHEFGLVGMILVFTGFAASLADLGLGASIIQSQSASDRHLNSAFWLSVAVGGALTLLFCIAAPLIAKIYGEPQLLPLTIGVAVIFLLVSLNTVQNALLEKSLNFRARFWIESIAIFVSGIVALALALAGAGVWSLVGQSVTSAAVRAVVMWRISSWRPGCSFDFAAVRELVGFGRHLLAFNAVIYWGQNFDKLVIGRMIGSSALGIYNFADRLMRLPLTNITGITGAVMFPALSALQDDPVALRRVYLRANRMIALLTYPMMMGLSALAEPAILVIYGDQWLGAVPIVQLLCFAGMAQSVYNTANWIFLSRGRPDILFRLGVYATLVRAAGVLVGVHWGIVGIAWAYVLGGYACILYPVWSAAGRLIDHRFSELVYNTAGPFACAIVMAGLVSLSNQWVVIEWPQWQRLLVHVLAGVIVYGFLVRWFGLQAWNDFREVILEAGGRRSPIVRWLLGPASR